MTVFIRLFLDIFIFEFSALYFRCNNGLEETPTTAGTWYTICVSSQSTVMLKWNLKIGNHRKPCIPDFKKLH